MIEIDYTSPETIGWILWIVYFVGLEGWALFRSRPGDTLSEHIWVWFGTQRGVPAKPKGSVQLRRVLLGGFMLWLGVHFMTGGWM